MTPAGAARDRADAMPRSPFRYRVSVVQGSSWPCDGLSAFASFWREALSQDYWPVLLEREDTKEILLAARGGKLMEPEAVFDLCLEQMEHAAETKRECPGVYTFPDHSITAMKLTIAKLGTIEPWR